MMAEYPNTQRYKFLSAITKPTVKMMFEAGRKGKMVKDKKSRIFESCLFAEMNPRLRMIKKRRTIAIDR